MSVQTRRKSQFRSLSDDHNDSHNEMKTDLECHFLVSYVGETDWQDEFTYVDEIMENILPKRMSGKFWLKKEPKRKVCLSVDVCSSSVLIQNTEGIIENCFKFSDVREVIYGGNMKQYSKYVILVVNGEVATDVKAHIFSCSSVKEAKTAFKTFTDMFTHASNEKHDLNQEDEDNTDVFSDKITTSPNLELQVDAEKQNCLSENELTSPEIEEDFVEGAFTAFARSRSFNTKKKYKPAAVSQ